MLKTPKNTLTVGGRVYNIVLTLSVIDELQAKYNGLDKVIKNVNDFNLMVSELAEIATIFINDDIERHNEDYPNDKREPITSSWLKRRIVLNKVGLDDGKILAVELSRVILNAFNQGMPTPDEDDFDPNSETTA